MFFLYEHQKPQININGGLSVFTLIDRYDIENLCENICIFFLFFFFFFFVTSHKFKSVFMGVFLISIKWVIMTCFWKRCNLLLPRHFKPLTPMT